MSNDLSMANIYGFGRQAWNPDLSLEQIADEWTRLTFGHNPKVVDTIKHIELHSYKAFENYTGPLGVGTLTDIHTSKYGPNIMCAEHDGWGQWNRADHKGIGNDRTVSGLRAKRGTGFIGQYNYEVMKMYESLETCPENVLLFMHHANYNHVLKSGLFLILIFLIIIKLRPIMTSKSFGKGLSAARINLMNAADNPINNF